MCEEIGHLSVGTYDGLLLCYRIWNVSSDCTEVPAEVPSGHQGFFGQLLFTRHPHEGAVRSLGSSSRYIASGGYDGSISLFDVDQLKVCGSLDCHEDSVDSLSFYDNSYLISGSRDKTLCVWRVRDRLLMKRLTGCTGGISCHAISGSGKLLLSSGQDKILRLWDLMRCHNAKTRSLGVCPVFVGFSDDSRYFVFGYDKEVHLVEGASETHVFRFPHSKAVTTFSLNCHELWVGTSDGHLCCWSIVSGDLLGDYVLSESRIKFVKSYERYLFVLTSSGEVHIGVVNSDHEVDTILEWTVNGRITCGSFGSKLRHP
jgi:protein MAK11